MGFWSKSREDEVASAFSFLLSSGYELVAKSAEGTGGRVTYRSKNLWIGIEWREGDPWIEFGPAGAAATYDWDLVDHLLRGKDQFERKTYSTRTAPVPQLAGFVRVNLKRIEKKFAADEREASLALLAHLRTQRGTLAGGPRASGPSARRA